VWLERGALTYVAPPPPLRAGRRALTMGIDYSIIGVATFLRVGNRDFGRAGFLRASAAPTWPADPPRAALDLAGRAYVVTGANAGLGRATVEALAARGASVHMLCRSRERGEAAREEIARATGNTNLTLHVVDVANRAAVREWASGFVATGQALDGLINNAVRAACGGGEGGGGGLVAWPRCDDTPTLPSFRPRLPQGVLLPRQELTSEGIDATFAPMVCSTYLLTGALVPVSAPAAGSCQRHGLMLPPPPPASCRRWPRARTSPHGWWT
jgi:NAD(P)-dependent dehydrogenase (short-subunit alcohol dehydrogenase family)